MNATAEISRSDSRAMVRLSSSVHQRRLIESCDALIQNRDELRRLLAPPAPSVATNVDRRCWRCGSPPTPPSPAQQVASIRVIQLGQPPAFQWAESELARLETRMESEPGCFVSMVRIDSVELVRIDGSKFTGPT